MNNENDQEITNEFIDQLESDVKNEIQTKEEILQSLKDTDKKISNNDNAPKDKVNLGELGTFKKASQEDIDDVFDKLPGTIFQLKTCLFRVCYIKSKNKFTAELVNG
jgi:hypothetical protein